MMGDGDLLLVFIFQESLRLLASGGNKVMTEGLQDLGLDISLRSSSVGVTKLKGSVVLDESSHLIFDRLDLLFELHDEEGWEGG